MASTSHSRVEECAPSASTYDVFINHRGLDVKHTLAITLYKMLTSGMGLSVLLDSEELELGDNLRTELEAAMNSANKNYLCEKQKKLLRDLCLKSVSVDNIEEGKGFLTRNLRFVQALIILDDFDHVDQLNALLPRRGCEILIGSGTLIIVITRELEILRG
ncbi:hypothetical protein SUGI_0536130 [Cryptomeria japonica]|nr:hypothetical protein SUGI_0536130 [Cryptomeria japonica]